MHGSSASNSLLGTSLSSGRRINQEELGKQDTEGTRDRQRDNSASVSSEQTSQSEFSTSRSKGEGAVDSNAR